MLCKLEKYILKLRSGYINDKTVNKTNFVYHLISIIFILKNIEFTTILYLFESDKIYIIIAIQYATLILLIVNLFIENRYIYIINFIFITILLNLKYGYNVEDMMFQITSFWLIFININKIKLIREFVFWRNDTERSGYIFLYGLNICITIFISGIGKIMDPIWIGNYGMYYVMSLPWISIPYFADLFRDNEILIITISKLAVIFELIVFPMYFIKRLRLFSIILLFVFWFSLLFPLRLDFIGPIGIISCFYLLSQQRIFKKI